MRLTSTDTQTDPGGLLGTYQVTTTQAINTGDAQVQGIGFTAIDRCDHQLRRAAGLALWQAAAPHPTRP
ncbi:hypothetical protein ACFQS6_06740 [Xanthomonas populi]